MSHHRGDGKGYTDDGGPAGCYGTRQAPDGGVLGGMGRTPQQILAFELTGKPATWQGLVLEDDNQPHVPVI